MKIRIMFDFGGEIYDWYMYWPHQYLPSIGHTFDICSFIEEGLIENFKDITFTGMGKYKGLEVTILEMLQNCYNTKIVEMNWNAHCVELEIKTDIYENKTRFWKEKDITEDE